ncbi:hypothetical protein DC094_10900 [Pelagibaculum spongiae]|uniref:Uncharacterized protein n=1 Tax=Pelagibaculum spongiae TaxID=2080658 RepID=A0A2V1GUV5_9GAMM|nr:hypothetical protein DC094_10900 [Pelagibaculum spongiae]
MFTFIFNVVLFIIRDDDQEIWDYEDMKPALGKK